MKKLLSILSLGTAVCVASLSAGLTTGEAAPGFSLTDASGAEVSLSDFSGKYVVLEWVNPGCPFVRKFYDPGAMQEFQAKVQEMGGVWLSINSTNPEHRDYLDPAATQAYIADKGVNSVWLLDADGEVGRAYGAATTPHCFVIDPEGMLIYQGAIDDTRSAKSEDIAGATNYVLSSLAAATSGEAVPKGQTRAYGCSVKY